MNTPTPSSFELPDTQTQPQDMTRPEALHADPTRPLEQASHLDIDTTLARITELLQLGDAKVAEGLAQALIQERPTNFRVMHALGMALHQRGKHREAVYWLTKVAKFTGERIEIGLALGNSLIQLGRHEHALKIFEKLIHETPDSVEALQGMVRAQRALGLVEDAITAQKQILALQPRESAHYFMIADLLLDAGRKEDALRMYHKCQINVAYAPRAYAAICDLTPHHGMLDASMQQAAALLEHPEVNDEDKAYLHRSLGHAFDELGHYHEAFEHFKKANQLQRLAMRYAVDQDASFFAALRQTFSAELFAAHQHHGAHNDSALFIVGLPRTGRHVLEELLCAHGRIARGDDCGILQAITHEPHYAHEHFGYPNYATQLSEEAIQAMGIEYLQRRGNREQSRYVTDCSELGYAYLGMAKLLLPRSKIIHITREVQEGCLAAYRHDCGAAYPFTHDLNELGEYHKVYTQLMVHWHNTLPEGSILQVRFEELVRDTQATLAQIFKFLDLPWDDACLNIIQPGQPLRASRAPHLREPLSYDSLDRAHHYSAHLASLRAALNIPEPVAAPVQVVAEPQPEPQQVSQQPEAVEIAAAAIPQETAAPLSLFSARQVAIPLPSEEMTPEAPAEVAHAPEVAEAASQPQPVSEPVAEKPKPKKPSGLDTLRLVSGFGSAYLFRGTLDEKNKDNQEDKA